MKHVNPSALPLTNPDVPGSIEATESEAEGTEMSRLFVLPGSSKRATGSLGV